MLLPLLTSNKKLSNMHRFSPQPHLEARMVFGDELRKARLRSGLSLDQAAKLAGVTSSCVNRVEWGKFSAGFDVIYSLLKAYGLQISFSPYESGI